MGMKGQRARQLVAKVVGEPRAFEADPIWGELARELLAEQTPVLHEPISYQTWGTDIDEGAHAQMRTACQVPSAVGGGADAGCAHRLRPADRRRAGVRERGDSVRGGRRHRLPDEAVGARHSGGSDRESAESV